jgi:hypothetical protein
VDDFHEDRICNITDNTIFSIFYNYHLLSSNMVANTYLLLTSRNVL